MCTILFVSNRDSIFPVNGIEIILPGRGKLPGKTMAGKLVSFKSRFFTAPFELK